MTSFRHSSPGEAGAEGTPPALRTTGATGTAQSEDACLDAARSALLDVGWRRTTLTEVARRAGVSRMTIYRRWPEVATLLRDLMTREWTDLTAAAVPAGTADAAEALADAVVDTVRALRANDLFARILELDPELLLPYLFTRPGRLQESLLALLVPHLEAGRAAGEIRDTDPGLLACSLLLTVHGFVLSLQTMTAPDPRRPEQTSEQTTEQTSDEAAYYTELHRLVRCHVSPGEPAGARPSGGAA